MTEEVFDHLQPGDVVVDNTGSEHTVEQIENIYSGGYIIIRLHGVEHKLYRKDLAYLLRISAKVRQSYSIFY